MVMVVVAWWGVGGDEAADLVGKGLADEACREVPLDTYKCNIDIEYTSCFKEQKIYNLKKIRRPVI